MLFLLCFYHFIFKIQVSGSGGGAAGSILKCQWSMNQSEEVSFTRHEQKTWNNNKRKKQSEKCEKLGNKPRTFRLKMIRHRRQSAIIAVLIIQFFYSRYSMRTMFDRNVFHSSICNKIPVKQKLTGKKFKFFVEKMVKQEIYRKKIGDKHWWIHIALRCLHVFFYILSLKRTVKIEKWNVCETKTVNN